MDFIPPVDEPMNPAGIIIGLIVTLAVITVFILMCAGGIPFPSNVP